MSPPAQPDEHEDGGASLRPRWLWIAFASIAFAIPLVGLLIERLR